MPDVKLRFEITDGGTVRVIEDVAEKTKKVGDEAEKSSNRASAAFDKLKIAAAATAAAVGAAATATAVAINRQFQQIDELAKVSRATGVTIRDLSGLQVAADLAGVSLEGVGTSLGIFSRRLVEAQTGVGKSGRIFDALGIDPRSGASTQQYLEQIADRFAELGTGAEATALSMELFGRSGARMVNLLVQGGQAIRDARAEAEAFGLVVDNTASDAIEQFNDNMSRLSSLSTGVARDLAVALSPTLAEISDETVDWAKANREVISSGLAEYLQGLGPIIKTTVDGLLLVNGALDAIADGVIRLMVGSQTNTDITRQVARRYASRGMSRWDLETPGGMSTPGDASFPIDLGAGVEDFARIAAAQSVVNERSREYTELLARIRGALGEARSESEGLAASSRAYASGTVWTPFVDGVQQFRDSVDLTLAQAELVPGVINNWTDSIEQAQVAAVDFGSLFADSLTSVVDSLMARDGGFDLVDVMSNLGRRAMSEMVGNMLREKLKFDTAFQANFLDFLPGVASQGADAIARSFGAGLQSIASQSANLGQVISGALTVNGLGAFADTGYGMSVDSLNYGGMTSAATGQAVLASGGAPLAQAGIAAAGASAGLSAFLGPLAAIGVSAFLGTEGFGLFSDRPTAAEIARDNIRDVFRSAGLIRGMALQEPRYALLQRDNPRSQGLGWIDQNRLGDPLFNVNDNRDIRGAQLRALAVLTQDDPTDISRTQYNTFLRDVALRGGQLYGGQQGGSDLYGAEIRLLAQGISPVQGLIGLNAARLTYEDNNRLTDSEYTSAVRGLLDLMRSIDEIPAGVDATAIAFDNVVQTTRGLIVNFEAFGEELDRQTGIARNLQSGVAGAGTSAITALLTGGDPTAAFRSGILNTVAGGVASNIVSTIFENGGGFAEALTQAVLAGDAAGVDSALAGVNGQLAMLTDAASAFTPVLAQLIDEVTGGTSSAQSYRDQRAGVLGIIDELQFSRLSPSQQAAELQRRINQDRGTLAGIIADDYIDPTTEQAQFDRVTGRLTSNAQALFRYGSNFAAGSRQAREIEQAALGALGDVESALSLAVGAIETQEIKVGTMNVSELRITPAAAASLVGGN